MRLTEDFLALDDETLEPCRICGEPIVPGTTFWFDDEDVYHGACIDAV